MFSSFLKSLNIEKGFVKTKSGFWNKIKSIVTKEKNVELTGEVLENIESMFISMDFGVDLTLKILNSVQKNFSNCSSVSQESLVESMRTSVISLLLETPKSELFGPPHVIIFVGINGVGKTTTVAKLANQYKIAGKKVLIAAADTFRAGAVNQLKHWANMIQVDICEPLNEKSSPSAVVYDSVKKAIDMAADVLIIDTAGRLHTKVNLMHELAKVYRTVKKLVPSAPHEVIMVIDATTGQNAINQIEVFSNIVKVTSLAITKLDGTAKGGIVVGSSDKFQLPVKYICVGENINDISLFDKDIFVSELFRV